MDRSSAPIDALLRELDALRKEVGHALQKSGIQRWVEPFTRMAFLPGLHARAYPLVNLSEDREAVYLEAMAPGVDPASLDISVLQTQLTLSGNKPEAARGWRRTNTIGTNAPRENSSARCHCLRSGDEPGVRRIPKWDTIGHFAENGIRQAPKDRRPNRLSEK
jgi:HSP20 family molecular chaperone IbpA